MKGQKGIGIFCIALLIGMCGGFFLNVQDVARCTTDFDYVTDVSGAFTGIGSDINVEHNPRDNITGYSVFDPDSNVTNVNTIPGISYSPTGANGYWIQSNDGNVSSDSITAEYVSTGHDGNGHPTGNITVTWGEGETATLDSDIVYKGYSTSAYLTANGYTNENVTGFRLSKLFSEYPTINSNKVSITLPNTTNGFPSFVAKPTFVAIKIPSYPSTIHYTDIQYESVSTSISYNPTTSMISMGTAQYLAEDILVVFGNIGRDTPPLAPSTITTMSMNMLIGSPNYTEYIDPNNGVQPVPVTVTRTNIVTTTTYSDEISGGIHLIKFANESTNLAISYTSTFLIGRDGNTPQVFSLTLSPNDLMSTPFVRIVNSAGQELSLRSLGGWGGSTINGGTSTLDLTWSWNVNTPQEMHFVFRGHSETSGTLAIPNALTTELDYASMSISPAIPSGNQSRIQITNLATDTSVSGTDSISINLAESVTHTETSTETYNNTYWTNKQKNTSLSLLLKAPTYEDFDDAYLNTFTNDIILKYELIDGTTASETLRYIHESDKWLIKFNGLNTSFGDWPAILITISMENGTKSFTVTPVERFESFTNYSLLGRSYTFDKLNDTDANQGNYKCLVKMTFEDTDTIKYLYHEVVSTIVLLEGGGMYIQEGYFSPANSFPNDEIIQFKIMSAVHVGSAVTVTTSNNVSYTYPALADGTGLEYHSKSYKFSDVSIYYVSQNVEPVAIEGQIYSGGLYYNGNYFDKGHLYIQFGKDGPIEDLGESSNAWGITLNGTWAVSTAYYTGENQAQMVTEWGDFSSFQWDKNMFIIVLLACMIGLSILVKLRYDLEMWDWIVIIGSCIILYILLG